MTTKPTENVVQGIEKDSQMAEIVANAATVQSEKTSDAKLNLKAEKTAFNLALAAISKSEGTISHVRVEQIPHVKTARDILTRVSAVYYKKTTTDTIKTRIRESFPVYSAARNNSDAILRTLQNDAGLTRGTALNLLALADNETLQTLVTTGHDGVTMGLGLAYRLAREKDLKEADYIAALLDSPAVTDVSGYLAARGCAKFITSQWSVFTAAREKHSASPTDATAAEMRVAWDAIENNLAAIKETGFTGILADMDSAVALLVAEEKTARDSAITAKATAALSALESAQEDDEKAKAKAESARQSHAANIAKVTNATNTLKNLESTIDGLKAQIDAAGNNAAKPLIAQLKTVTADTAKARAELEKARADADAAALAANKASETATTAAKELTNAQSMARVTTAATAKSKTRPTANDIDSLVAVYAAMDADALRRELAEVTAEVSAAGHLAHWAALGRGLVLNLFE